MKVYKYNWIACVCLVTMMPACAGLLEYRPYARSVKKMPQKGGVIALHTDHRMEDQDLAKRMMSDNCGPKKVQIMEEGEVVVGSVTQSNSQAYAARREKVGSVFGVPVTSGNDGQVNTSSETTDKKEWQIKYECQNG